MLAIERSFQPAVWDHNLGAVAISCGTLVTASGSIHTKGNWAELIAATTYDWHGFWLSMGNSNASAAVTDMLLDIGLGSAGNEVVLLPDFHAGWSSNNDAEKEPIFIPLYVPKGSRVAARIQALIASDTVRVSIVGLPGTSGLFHRVFVGCDAYGIVASTSRGTLHTPGNSGAFSTDASIGGTASKSYGAVILRMSPTTSVTSFLAYHWELRIGGVTGGLWRYVTSTAEIRRCMFPPSPAYLSVPSGTQMQVRATCSGTAQQSSVSLYAFY